MIYSKIKVKQTNYAKIIFKKGFQSKKIYMELNLLGLYFRDALRLKSSRRKEELEKFCKKHLKNYNKYERWGLIDSCLKFTSKKKNKLIDVPKINIYEDELKYIKSLNISHNCQKLLFTFLIYDKIAKCIYKLKYYKVLKNFYYQGSQRDYSKLRAVSNIPDNVDILKDIITELNAQKFVTCLHKGIIRLDFLENCNGNGKILLPEVIDYDNIGKYFDYYNQVPRVILCKKCGFPFKKKNNRQKYCRDCATKINILKTNERAKKP